MKRELMEIIQKAADDSNVELYDVEWEQQFGQKVLHVMVETDAGVTLNECVAVNRLLCDLIPEDMIKGEYQLEVSSPGIERKLRNYKDVKKYVGHTAKVKLYEKLEGVKEFDGQILSATEHPLGYVVTMMFKGRRVELHSETIATIKLSVEHLEVKEND